MTTMGQAQSVLTTDKITQLAPELPRRSQSNLARSMRRLRKHRMAIAGAVILLLIALWVIVGSFIFTEQQANTIDATRLNEAPSSEHPFGMDEVGRDVLIRTVYGGQISLFIGVSAAALEILVGTMIGLAAGYFSGKNIIDSVLMRLVEIMLSIPQLMLVLVIVKMTVGKITSFTILGREFSSVMVIIIIVIALTSWMQVARIVRSTVLSVREQEYITAARSVGVNDFSIVFRHILPNCLSPIIVAATLGVGAAILLEAYLGFLGLGVPAPTATWGSMLSAAHDEGILTWHLWLFPGLFIVMTVLGINFLGDGLRDALDPKQLNA
ncbi:MAG TPA: ABC transporter permease [Aggregatilineales bacterium]|nr:ABC transporter permease [Aggregatilineales bacterium]